MINLHILQQQKKFEIFIQDKSSIQKNYRHITTK